MENITIRCDMSVELVQSMGSDEMIFNAAKISTSGARIGDVPEEQMEGLINYLLKNRHGTPFEHGAMTFRIEAPIFVFREWHRHRVGWSYNEESARYKRLDPVFWIPGENRHLKQTGKAGHYIYELGTSHDLEKTLMYLSQSYELAYHNYSYLLSIGIAREVARACLPVAIYSSMYATCNPRSLMHFLSLRTKSETATFPSFPQAEIEECAVKMEEHFSQLFPITYQAFNRNGRIAP